MLYQLMHLDLFACILFVAEQIEFYVDWGEKYQPKVAEIDERIKELNSEIKSLKELKKVLIENANNV